MKITLNGIERDIENLQNLETIIRQSCKNTGRVIAELNGEIIKAPRWEGTTLREGDSVELVSFVGGG